MVIYDIWVVSNQLIYKVSVGDIWSYMIVGWCQIRKLMYKVYVGDVIYDIGVMLFHIETENILCYFHF